MAIKNKNNNNFQEMVTDVAQQAGLVLMAASAAMLNVPEPSHARHHAIAPIHQPALAAETAGGELPQGGGNGGHRREREETGPHYISYGGAQRTPARAGRA